MSRRAKVCAAALIAVLAALAPAGCGMSENLDDSNTKKANSKGEDVATRDADKGAIAVHRRAVAIDMHADTVQFIIDEGADITAGAPDLHLDAARMREGGLDAQFFSIWVEPQQYGAGGVCLANGRGFTVSCSIIQTG